MNTKDVPKRRRRRRGYRGYGSPLHEGAGGTVHWGRGFSGVEFLRADGSLLPPGSDLLPETLRTGQARKA